MICTSMTLHPEWNRERRRIRAEFTEADGARMVGVYVKERGEGAEEGSAEFGIYGPAWVVLATLDEMRRTVSAAVNTSPTPTVTEAPAA